MKTLYIFVFLLLTFEILPAQVTQEWVARYNGSANFYDRANSMAVDGSGNVYVTGYIYRFATQRDYCTIKYNSSGVEQWVAIYNGPQNSYDQANSIAIDDSGNVYVTGGSNVNIGNSYYVTIKYNSSGDSVWVKRYSSPGDYNGIAKSITIDDSGYIYVAGSSSTYYVTIKYNSSGDSVWVKRIKGSGALTNAPISIAVDVSGNVYETASWTNGNGNVNYVTIKYNSSGDSVWVKSYDGSGNDDVANSIAIDDSGNVYVTGKSRGIGTSEDYCTIKYNSSGDSVWVKRYDGPVSSFDEALSIVVDFSGNVYVTGNSRGIGTSEDYCTIKYNSSGDSVWVKRFNGSGNSSDVANSIAIDVSGNVYVTGKSPGIGTPSDYATIKYNSSGVEQWVQKYNGPGENDDEATSIKVDSSGNVYVTGVSIGIGNGDYATIKYSQSVGINQINSEVPNQFGMSQNYPNPFNPNTKIRFEISKTSRVHLVVYDLIGKIIANLADEKLQPGTYEVEFDGSKFSSGIYFYRIETESFLETKKMLLLK